MSYFNKNAIYYLLPNNSSIYKFTNKNKSFSDFFVKTKFNLVLMFHVKFSTLYFSTQFLDNLAYDLPKKANLLPNSKSKSSLGISLGSETIYFLHFFLLKAGEHLTFWFLNKPNNDEQELTTLEDLFFNANWSEREVSEMNGLFFEGKNDNRNLLLSYSEFSYPLKKHSPSIGFYNLFYDVVSDSVLKVGINQTSNI